MTEASSLTLRRRLRSYVRGAAIAALRGSCVLAGSLLVLALVLRYVDVKHPWEAALVSVFPALAVVSAAAAALLFLTRWRLVAAAQLVLAVVALTVITVQVYGNTAPVRPGLTLRVISCNLKYGEADAGDVVAALRNDHAAVFMAEELTEQEVQRLDAAGIAKVLPYSSLAAGPVASGVGLWTAAPLTRMSGLPVLFNRVAGGTVQFDGRALSLLVVHIAAPWPTDAPSWNSDLSTLRSWLDQSPVDVVGGDFNSTINHEPFRHLMSAGSGYTDAAADAGALITRSFPAEPVDLPVIGIDHLVLARPVSATGFHTETVHGTDHRAIVVAVRVPSSGP